jgi:hypothetical protein
LATNKPTKGSGKTRLPAALLAPWCGWLWSRHLVLAISGTSPVSPDASGERGWWLVASLRMGESVCASQKTYVWKNRESVGQANTSFERRA